MSRLVAALVGVSLLGLAACGGKDDPPDGGDELDTIEGGVGSGEGATGAGDQVLDSGGSGGSGSAGGTDGSVGWDTACERFVASWGACLDGFGGDHEDYGLTEGYCDAFTDSVYDDLFHCYADALDAGDCSTVDGYSEAATVAADCSG